MNRRRRKANTAQEAPSVGNDRKSKPQLSLAKKLLFSTLVTVSFFVALEFALAATGWKPLVAEEDPYVGFASQIPLFVEVTGADGRPELVTAENKTRWFNRQRFSKKKSANTYRIFCLGGSTTYGHPYDDPTSFAGWLRELLPEVDPSRKWEVVNCGGISYASYRVVNVLKELLQYEPDLFVVYSGHNEFLEARTYAQLIEAPGLVLQLGSVCSRTRTYAVLSRLVLGKRAITAAKDPRHNKDLLSAEVNTLLDSAVGPAAYHRDDGLRREILQHYEFNLRRMVELATNGGAELVLVTPASNLANCSPFKSEHRADLEAAAQRKWEASYALAQERFRSGNHSEALQAINQATRIDPQNAAGVYLRGQILSALGEHQEARKDFIAARDEDVCTLRAPTEFIEVVRKVAQDMRVPLIDFVAHVDRLSPARIPGDNLFLDHVHPTIEGYRDLAVLIVSSLREIGAVSGNSQLSQEMIAAVSARIMSRVDTAAHGVALRNVSKVLSWAGKKEDADRLALRAMELVPDDAETVYQAANAHVRMGKVDEAIQLFERALKLNPNNAATIHASMGYAFGLKGDEQKSVEHYQQALQINPDFSDIHHNLATIYENRGELDAAVRHYQKAVAGNPHHYFAQYRLGLVFALQQKWVPARTQFEAALRLNPSSVNAHLCLGQVLAQQGDIASAREHFQWILRHYPEHAETLAELRRLDQ